jgi:hypothetical protein
MDLFASKVAKYSPRLQKDVVIKGFQADGVFGNLGEESNGFSQLHQVGGNGLGWAQWDDRRQNFEKWASDHGLTVEDDEANYGFLVHELKTTENHALAALQATRTRDDATRSVHGTSLNVQGCPLLMFAFVGQFVLKQHGYNKRLLWLILRRYPCRWHCEQGTSRCACSVDQRQRSIR